MPKQEAICVCGHLKSFHQNFGIVTEWPLEDHHCKKVNCTCPGYIEAQSELELPGPEPKPLCKPSDIAPHEDCSESRAEATLHAQIDRAAETLVSSIGESLNREREAVYGHPWDDFTNVGQMSGPILSSWIPYPLKHSLYMIQVKISRLLTTPDHQDSIDDIEGYLTCYRRCLARYKESFPSTGCSPAPQEGSIQDKDVE